jgi:NPCBM/NEW2 domain
MVTALVAFSCLVGHGVRMAIFNHELRGLTAVIAAIPPHADVRGLVTNTDHESAVFGGMLGQTPAWVTAANAGFLENDSGGYFQLPIQRPRGKPWIAEYRWSVARGGADTPARVSGWVGWARVVAHADDWWLFESMRPPPATGGLEVVRYAQEWKSLQVGRSLDGHPLRVAGHTFASGFGTHALSRIQVRVQADGKTLHGQVGIDDEAGGPTEVVFKIGGTNGPLLYESPPIGNGQPAVPFAVPLGGRRDLILSAEISPRCKSNSNAHADWLDLKVD